VTLGQTGIVPLFATPFAAVDTGADQELNSRLRHAPGVRSPYYGPDTRITVASNCWFELP